MSLLAGRFGNTTGRPYIEGRLVLPRPNLSFHVSFIVDTGADQTVLMPDDGMTAGIDYNDLQGGETVSGVGGAVAAYVESAIVLFTIPKKRLFAYNIDLLIFPVAPDLQGMPSLLGRNILDSWRMTYSPLNGQLEFDVLASDIELSVD